MRVLEHVEGSLEGRIGGEVISQTFGNAGANREVTANFGPGGLNFLASVVLEEEPGGQFAFGGTALGHADAGAINIHGGFSGGVGDGRNGPSMAGAFAGGSAVVGQARAGANGEEQGAIAKVSLVAVGFGDELGAVIGEQTLQEGHGVDSGLAVVGKFALFVIIDIATKGEGPGSEAGSIDAQLVTIGAFSSSFGEGSGSGFAGHFFELLGGLGSGGVTQLGQPVLIVVQDFHGAVGGEAQAGIAKVGEDILSEEAREEVGLIFSREAPLFAVDQGVHVNQRVSQLVGSSLVLVSNNQIGNIGSVQDGQHFVEDISIGALVFGGHGDAILIGLVEFINNGQQGFFASLGVIVPENNALARRINASPFVNNGGFGGNFGQQPQSPLRWGLR